LPLFNPHLLVFFSRNPFRTSSSLLALIILSISLSPEEALLIALPDHPNRAVSKRFSIHIFFVINFDVAFFLSWPLRKEFLIEPLCLFQHYSSPFLPGHPNPYYALIFWFLIGIFPGFFGLRVTAGTTLTLAPLCGSGGT